MKVEFYLNDKCDKDFIAWLLSMSVTLKTWQVSTIWIDGKEYNLNKIREMNSRFPY